MDKTHRKHLNKIKKTFKAEDYKKMDEFSREMMGSGPNREELEFLDKIRKAEKKSNR